MDSTRREFLVSASALAVVPACAADQDPNTDAEPGPAPLRPPEPEPWAAPGVHDLDAFHLGVQCGDATTDSVILSVHTAEPVLELVVMQAIEDSWQEHSRQSLDTTDGFVQIELDGLEADTAYAYTYYADDARRSLVGRFRTAIDLNDETLRTVTFGATCCLGGNQPWPSLTAAASEQFDFFCLLGDTVYADAAFTYEEYMEYWEAALGTQGLVDLLSSTSVIANWDDHEVDNNWTWNDEGIEERFEGAIRAFRDSLPQRIGPGGTGVWRTFSWGKVVQVFSLDSRAERHDGNYISPEQMTWLKEGLANSPARFKIILNTVPISDFSSVVGSFQENDRWQGYPEQRAEIVEFIRDESIPGVLWIAGDFHFGSLNRLDAAGGPGFDQWEVLAGPGGSTLNWLATLVQPTEQFVFGLAEWNYVSFVCDPSLGTISLQFVGDDGQVINEAVLEV